MALIKIRNNRTGEVLTVDDGNLQDYGLNQSGQSSPVTDPLMTPTSQMTNGQANDLLMNYNAQNQQPPQQQTTPTQPTFANKKPAIQQSSVPLPQNTASIPERLKTGAMNNIGDAVKGAGQAIMNTYIQPLIDGFNPNVSPQQKLKSAQNAQPMQVLSNAAVAAGKGIVNEAKNLAPVSFKDGKAVFDPGKTLNYAIDNPVNVALDVAGARGAYKGIMGKGNAATAANANPVQNVATGVSEVVNGGGPKDFIARNVNLDESRPLSQTLLDKNILGSPTEKGRIVATQQALTDVGQNLQKTLSSSPITYEAKNISDGVQTYLEQNYPQSAKPLIEEIVNKLKQEGGYDLKSNTSPLSALQVNQLKTALMDYGPKAFNLPNGGPMLKQMALDVAGKLRGILARDVPQATNDLRDYGNLKTYMNDVLGDPKGTTIHGFNDVLGLVGNNAKTVANMATQGAYNTAGGTVPGSSTVNNATQALQTASLTNRQDASSQPAPAAVDTTTPISSSSLNLEKYTPDNSTQQPTPQNPNAPHSLQEYNNEINRLTMVGGNPTVRAQAQSNADQLRKDRQYYYPNINNKVLAPILQTDENLAKSGLRAYNAAIDQLNKDPNIVVSASLPGSPGARMYESAIYAATDNLLKLKTGKTANEGEIKGYMWKLFPAPGDSLETIRYKMNARKLDLEDYTHFQGADPGASFSSGDPLFSSQ